MDISAENYQQQQQYQQYQQQSNYDPSQQLHPQQASFTQTSNAQPYYYDYNNTQHQQQHQYYYPPYHYTHSYAPPRQTHLGNYSNSYHNYPIGFDPLQSSNLSGANVDGSIISQNQIGKSTHRGGKRGGRSFRGGGRGQSARGRGQGGGRNPSMPPSASVPGQAQVPAAPLQPPPRIAWCELCRVDCNTMEILEQHKNGKKHKKNLKIHEELQKLNNNITGQQIVQMNNPEVKPDGVQFEEVGGCTAAQKPEKLLSGAVTVDNKNELDQQKDDVGKSKESGSDSAEVAEKKSRDQFEGRGRGLKRKMRGGRGGKFLKTNAGPRRPVEPPKPKEVVPFMCQLCNVKCESQVVFDSHLAGKKHLAKLKRFHSHQALYGEAGVQALYPPNLDASSSSAIPQIQQVINDPQVVLAQLLNYVLTHAQPSGTVGTHLPLLSAASAAAVAQAIVAPATAPALETEKDHCPNQEPETVSTSGNDMEIASEVGQQHVTAEFKAPSTGNADHKDENKTAASETSDGTLRSDSTNSTSVPQDGTKDVGPTVDSSITAASAVENINLEQKQVAAAPSDSAVRTPQDIAKSEGFRRIG